MVLGSIRTLSSAVLTPAGVTGRAREMAIASAQAALYGTDIRYLAAKKAASPETYVSLIVAKETGLVGRPPASFTSWRRPIQCGVGACM